MVNGRRERKYDAAWTEDDARAALVARQAELAVPAAPAPTERTVQELAQEYLAYKAQRGKRSLKEDTRILATRILPAFGSDLPVRQLTGAAIAQYERKRAGEVSAYTAVVPDVDMPKKPDGRREYLDESKITRLLKACGPSKNRYLATIVTVALNTGMRKAEILGLEWATPTTR